MKAKHKDLISKVGGIVITVVVMCAFAVAGGAITTLVTDSNAAQSIVAMGSGVGGAWVVSFFAERVEDWWENRGYKTVRHQ